MSPDTQQIDIQALARELAARMAPDALLDAEDVGALLHCSAKHVRTNYSLSPGFPGAIRLTTHDGKKGHPKWRRSEVMEWIAKHQDGWKPRGGRPRRRTED